MSQISRDRLVHKNMTITINLLYLGLCKTRPWLIQLIGTNDTALSLEPTDEVDVNKRRATPVSTSVLYEAWNENPRLTISPNRPIN